ncbi:MAG TPA: hypothetical protein VN213_03810 [Solirubrobacteraceae bacterium]|nr:hypothetical protein [Solirubrobacteraceae bacterium]
MPRLAAHATAVVTPGAAPRTDALSERAFRFAAAVVAIQGVHVVEHVIQLAQVYVFGVADEDALGLLGYVIQFNGTEEWLHLGFNSLYLASLYALVVPFWRLRPRALPVWAFALFAGSVWLESWHVVEHAVIISRVIANAGCPCPGIGDAALGVSDTILHFAYNVVAYAGVVVAFAYAARARRAGRP